jgi:hypothetical protein
MEPERGESVAGHCSDRDRHEALPGMWRADPISEHRRLHDAASDLPQTETTDKPMIVITKDQERVGFVVGDLLLIVAQSAPERGAR